VLDLSARTKFGAGPFSGEVISTVRAALGRSRVIRSDQFPEILRVPRGDRRRTRFWVLDLQYRIRGVSGALVTDFHGLPDPACRALGACGASGRSSYSLKGVSGRIDVFGGRRLRSGHRRPAVRAALRQMRRGALPVYADSRLFHARAAVSETVTAPGAACTDSMFTKPPFIDARSTGRSVVLLLRSSEPGPPGDTLRTRCPGPSQSDVLGRASLAHGRIPLAGLGGKGLDVSVGSGRTFSRNGYAGSRQGALALRLELVRSRVYVVRG
jgi:hypothetical protein